MAVYIVLIALIITVILIIKKQKHKVSTVGNDKNTIIPASIEHVTVASEIPVYWYEDGKKKEGVAKLTQGLQVFDKNGKCIVNVTDRLTKCLGVGYIDRKKTEGYIYNSALNDKCELWYVLLKAESEPETQGSVVAEFPELTKENGRIKWKYGPKARSGGKILYGVY